MTEEQKMIFAMLKAGEITAEEAERLMEALPSGVAGAAGNAGTVVQLTAGTIPQRLLVTVTEHGRQRTRVRIPFTVVRLALKLGRSMDRLIVHFGGPDGAKTAEMLQSIDLDEILRQIGDGEIPLPCTLADIDAEDKNVKVELE
ncbi:MAG: hypothetical protein LBJ11_07215 [Oscillospiraceae bacterium]|jgi:hypothetical protein|nr:hypothetical protein [Oscillospiraceae bacterium]